MSDSNDVNYKWVAIGAVVIIGLAQLLHPMLGEALGGPLIESMGPTAGSLVYISIIAIGSFFVGGAIVGWWSPGETIKEPALAGIVAVVINAGINFRNVDGEVLTVSQWLIGSGIMAVVGFGLALGGGVVGEKLQGDTTDKMRERGEMPK